MLHVELSAEESGAAGGPVAADRAGAEGAGGGRAGEAGAGRSSPGAGSEEELVTGTPCWFGPADRALAGWVHGDRAGGGPVVVICPPVGRELGASYRALRRVAEELACRGVLAVRFDYDGTGDSAGSDTDPGRVAAWLASVEEAVALARSLGDGRVALLGLRAGALLAEVAAERLGGVSAIALWDPFASGKALVRHQRALQLLDAELGPWESAGAELLGFQLRPEEVADLAGLAPAPGERAVAPRALVLRRLHDAGAERVVGRLGPGVTVHTMTDHAAFVEARPEEQVLPEESLGVLVGWLAEALTAGEAGGCPDGGGEGARLGGEAVVGSGAAGAIVERPVRIGGAGLFAMETSPERARRGAPVVLFLNAATDHHIGPNRLWVELSRRWAALGVRSFRLDLSGIGDSPARPGAAEQVIRSPHAFDDVREVAEAVAPEDPGNVVLVGLCSGAYQALEGALELRARGVLAVNPSTMFVPPETLEGEAMDGRRRICRPATQAGRRYRRMVPSGLRQHLRPLVWRLYRALHRERAPERWLGALKAAGVDTFMVCGRDEARPIVEGARGELGDMEATGQVQIEVIEHLNHGLLLAAHREAVAERFTERLVEVHLQAQGGPAVAVSEVRGIR